MRNPFFTVIIPTYNREAYILNTLNTVFAQTFTDYEVIVVDNCSTDNTEKILSPLVSEGKIHYIKHDKNYERAKSRNTGIKNAKGEYITYLDSDDFMYPSNLKDAYEFAMENPDIFVFHNLYEVITEDKKIIYRYLPRKRHVKNAVAEIAKGNFLSCNGVFLKKDIYSKVLWDENPILIGFEDYDYWLRVIAEYPKVGRIYKVNGGVLEHSDRSVNTDKIDHALRRTEYLISKIKSDEFLRNVYKKYIDCIHATLYIYIAYMGLLKKDKNVIIQHLVKAFKIYPLSLARKGFMSLLYKVVTNKV